MPVFWLAAILLYYLTFKVELFPTGGYVPLTEDPLEWAYHLILPWFTLAVLYRRLLQPRAALEHARRDERGLRAHRAGQGPQRAPGADPPRAAQLADPDRHPVRPRLRRRGRRRRDPHRDLFNLDGVGLYAAEAIGNLDLPPMMAVTLFGAFFIVLFNTLVDIVYAYLDPRVRLGEAAP